MDDDQQFCLRWNNHQSTLVAVFDTLLENGTLVDCTLAAEGKFLNAHKVVLSACSPYFEALLSRHYDKHPILILKDVKFQELKAMMDYMYRGEVNISQDQLGALLKAAESLQIKGLSDNKKDEGTTTKRPAPSSVPKSEQPQAALPKVQGLSIEQRNRDDRDGSTSPGPRKKKRMRRKSEEMDNHQDASNSSESHSLPAQNIPLAAQLPVKMSSTDVPEQIETKQEILRHKEESAQQQVPIIKEKIETHTELMLEPKSEYVEEGNDDSIEDLTLDDDDLSNMEQMDEGAGPSHGDGSQQGFGHWQMGNQSQDEVFLAAQEAVGAHRDSQGYRFTPERECNKENDEDDDFLRERPVSSNNNFSRVSLNKLTDGLLKLPKMPPPKLKKKPFSRSLESIADIEADQWDIASRASSRMPTPEPPRRSDIGLTADKILNLLREISRRKEENVKERQLLSAKENLPEPKRVDEQLKSSTEEPEKKKISFNLMPGRKSRDWYQQKKLIPKPIENTIKAKQIETQNPMDVQPQEYNKLPPDIAQPFHPERPPEDPQYVNFLEPPPFFNPNTSAFESGAIQNMFAYSEQPVETTYPNTEVQPSIYVNNQPLETPVQSNVEPNSAYETTSQTGYTTYTEEALDRRDTYVESNYVPHTHTVPPPAIEYVYNPVTPKSKEVVSRYNNVNGYQPEPQFKDPNMYRPNNIKAPLNQTLALEEIGTRRYSCETNTDPVYKTIVSPYDPTKYQPRNFQRDNVGRRFNSQDNKDNVVIHNVKVFNRTKPLNNLDNIGSRRQIPVARKEILLTENNFCASRQEPHQTSKSVSPVSQRSRSSEHNFETNGQNASQTNVSPISKSSRVSVDRSSHEKTNISCEVPSNESKSAFEHDCPPPPSCSFDEISSKGTNNQQLFTRRTEPNHDTQNNKEHRQDIDLNDTNYAQNTHDDNAFVHGGYYSSTPKLYQPHPHIENEIRNVEPQTNSENNDLRDTYVDCQDNDYLQRDNIPIGEQPRYEEITENDNDILAPPPPEISFEKYNQTEPIVEAPEPPILREPPESEPVTNNPPVLQTQRANNSVTIFKKVYTCSGCSFKIANEKKFKIHLKFVHGQTPDVISPENIKMVEQQPNNQNNMNTRKNKDNANKPAVEMFSRREGANKCTFKRRSYQGVSEESQLVSNPQKHLGTETPNDVTVKRSNECERVKEAFRDPKRFKESQFSGKRRGGKTLDEFMKDDWQ